MQRFILPLGLVLLTALALTPAGARADNREIAEQIARVMKVSGAMKGYNVFVTYTDGVAKLQGTVTNEQQMQTAISIAKASPHVNRVLNEMSVNPGSAASAAIRPAKPLDRPVRISKVALSSQPTPTQQPQQAQLQQAQLQQAQLQQAQLQQAQLQRAQALGPIVRSAGPAIDQIRTTSRGIQQPATRLQANPRLQPQAFSPIPAALGQQQSSRRNASHPVPVAPSSLGAARGAGRPPQMRGPMQVAMAPPAAMAAMAAAPMAAMGGMPMGGGPQPAYVPGTGGGVAPAGYDQPQLPAYAWPSYAPYPNYAALTYPKQYSPTAWPYIGPFYPYPQVPLGWRKVTLEWDDGWWFLDFKNK